MTAVPSVLPQTADCSITAQHNAPIGLFDSGLGGLTVVRRLQQVLPHERIVFVADQAHVPYGGRDLKQICGFACGITDALVRHGCKAVVMACNISSASGLASAQATHPTIPILGVIEPGAKQAARLTRNKRVGVLATEGTVRSGAYTRALHALDPEIIVTEVACPAFVPLVEAGQENTPAASEAACHYLACLQSAGVDTLVLGCTHYPFLLPQLQRHRPDLLYVDPADQTVQDLARLLATHNLLAPTPPTPPSPLLTTTGDGAVFAHQLLRFLPHAQEMATIAPACWQNGLLHIAMQE